MVVLIPELYFILDIFVVFGYTCLILMIIPTDNSGSLTYHALHEEGVMIV